MEYCNTVLGKIDISELGIILPHEHICCYYEPFYMIAKDYYLDKELLKSRAIEFLKQMKDTYGLGTMIDCTPINLGRDIELLKDISRESGVHIIASSGFYHTEESILEPKSEEYLCDMIVYDVRNTNAGLLKFAVDCEHMTKLNKKLLSALCMAQKTLNIPLCIHTNAFLRNGTEVADFVLECGVNPSAVTIAHSFDSDDNEYITEFLNKGFYIGFDRFYKRPNSEEFFDKKLSQLYELYKSENSDRIVISHDAVIYNEFCPKASVVNENPYDFIFKDLIPKMQKTGFTDEDINKLMRENPVNMLMMK